MANDVTEIKATLGEVQKDLDNLRGDLRRLVASVGDVARDRAEFALNTTRTQIAEHPLAATGAAFGVGLLLGFLVTRGR